MLSNFYCQIVMVVMKSQVSKSKFFCALERFLIVAEDLKMFRIGIDLGGTKFPFAFYACIKFRSTNESDFCDHCSYEPNHSTFQTKVPQEI
jgi:hypothetical protein